MIRKAVINPGLATYRPVVEGAAVNRRNLFPTFHRLLHCFNAGVHFQITHYIIISFYGRRLRLYYESDPIKIVMALRSDLICRRPREEVITFATVDLSFRPVSCTWHINANRGLPGYRSNYKKICGVCWIFRKLGKFWSHPSSPRIGDNEPQVYKYWFFGKKLWVALAWFSCKSIMSWFDVIRQRYPWNVYRAILKIVKNIDCWKPNYMNVAEKSFSCIKFLLIVRLVSPFKLFSNRNPLWVWTANDCLGRQVWYLHCVITWYII